MREPSDRCVLVPLEIAVFSRFDFVLLLLISRTQSLPLRVNHEDQSGFFFVSAHEINLIWVHVVMPIED